MPLRLGRKRSSLQTLQEALRPTGKKGESLAGLNEDDSANGTPSRSRKWASGWSEYSDLTVTCGGRAWPVHKLVLCTQSEFFRNACKDHFREGKDNTINLEDDDPQVVHAMLAFLYEAEYEPPPDINQWAFHAHIAAIADKYFIEPLEKHAEHKFDHYHKNAAALGEFPDAIVAAYDTENKHLRRTVLEVVKSNHARLFSKRSEPSAFKQVLREIPEFAAAVAEALAEQLGAASEKLSSGVLVPKKTMNSMKWYQCPSYECRDENTVFSLPARLSYSPYISCPLGCSDANDRKSSWWAKYEIDNPLSPVK